MNMKHALAKLGANFVSLTEQKFAYGPQGSMVLRNLEEQWFLHCVTMSRYNIFLSEKVSDTLNFIVKSSTSDVPFGLAVIENSKNSWNQSVAIDSKWKHQRIGTITIFNNDMESKDLYHKLQKERRIWWRKLAQRPSRFKVTEPKKKKNLDTVDIEAQFPFGTVVVEKITYHTDIQKMFSEIDNKKDFTNVQMVEHTVCLDWGCLALLCDAYDTDESARMQIHFKLAPHKVAICIEERKNDVGNDDLNRFVLYLNNMLRTKGLNTILTSPCVVDTCLVPFVVLVHRTSLENGIIRITNRSTTLSEAIHITDLANYIIKYC
ncbi:DNA polymerase subunit gamma-2, mitochondrial [Hylaeus anthracinus]|uniref:DNA polymerase subunit gamma-2, mitochondrial n=1 Tax=Hylaeus anthracinus TaxID=313031 RepID=UPI0023BA034F|nr:DNA polymerase subunit gamma-2, mitochondrial [Hylaeus anthracinus]